MIGHLSFAGTAFQNLIRYQITDRYRPTQTPVAGPTGGESYLDGLHILDITLERSSHQDPFALNRREE